MNSFLRKREIVRSLAGDSTTTKDGPRRAAEAGAGALTFFAVVFFLIAALLGTAFSLIGCFFSIPLTGKRANKPLYLHLKENIRQAGHLDAGALGQSVDRLRVRAY